MSNNVSIESIYKDVCNRIEVQVEDYNRRLHISPNSLLISRELYDVCNAITSSYISKERKTFYGLKVMVIDEDSNIVKAFFDSSINRT